ncbi:hypothetical protein [Chryseobacterium sp.]|uniref:hypothetical protein n=1 Tax=Chryseobacterium sp. TaxID=1871047 RepID=UPI002FCAE7B3
MKINNKKEVNTYMAFQLVVMVLLFLITIALNHLGYHLFSRVFALAALLVLLYGILKNQFVFEYENSGQVISIKSYQWLSLGRKMPVFEMPHKKIVRTKIKEHTFRKYLIIVFFNSSGKMLKRNIDITFCSKSQANQLLRDITNNLAKKNKELISEK